MAITTTRQTLADEVAKSLGCWISTTVGTAYTSGTLLNLPNLKNHALDDQRFQYAYVRRADGLWRLIVDTSLTTTGDATLAEAFPDAVGLGAGATVGIYLVLDPAIWLWCVDQGLQEEFRKTSFLVTLISDTTEYDLSSTAPWLQLKGQVIRMRYRDSTTNLEEDLSVVYLIENDYSLTLKIPVMPSQYDQIRIEAKKYYTDTDAVTLPPPLAKTRIRLSALEQIFVTLGPGAKQYWGQQMVLTSRRLYEEEARWKPQYAEYREPQTDDQLWGGDDVPFSGWDW